MAEFPYSNITNASTGHTLFEFNCGYKLIVFFKENVDPCSKSCSANKQAEKLRELMKIYC